MANYASSLLTVLLIGNPFVLLVFQNCNNTSQATEVSHFESLAPEINRDFSGEFKKTDSLHEAF